MNLIDFSNVLHSVTEVAGIYGADLDASYNEDNELILFSPYGDDYALIISERPNRAGWTVRVDRIDRTDRRWIREKICDESDLSLIAFLTHRNTDPSLGELVWKQNPARAVRVVANNWMRHRRHCHKLQALYVKARKGLTGTRTGRF